MFFTLDLSSEGWFNMRVLYSTHTVTNTLLGEICPSKTVLYLEQNKLEHKIASGGKWTETGMIWQKPEELLECGQEDMGEKYSGIIDSDDVHVYSKLIELSNPLHSADYSIFMEDKY